MLYFSKLRILFISLFSVFFILIALSNFLTTDKSFFNKKINLGLDLQGGSYLLLEIDNDPVIEQKLQNLTVTIRNYFKDKDIKVTNFKLTEQTLLFSTDKNFQQIVLDEFQAEDSKINPYYQRFKSHQLDIEQEENFFKVSYSKQGIINLKSKARSVAD